jgi:hypothetical protein
MDPAQVKTWIEIVQGAITIAASLVGGLWVWSRFVLERGLLPPSEIDLDLRTVGGSESARIVELEVLIRNKGSSALVVTDVRVRLLHLQAREPIELIGDTKRAAFGRVKFPHAFVLNEVGAGERTVKVNDKPAGEAVLLGKGEFLVLPYDTFVQPGVEQLYTFITALPAAAMFVLARASFRYAVRPSKAQLLLLRLSRSMGMIQYSLDHIRQPHTIEKSFGFGEEITVANKDRGGAVAGA